MKQVILLIIILLLSSCGFIYNEKIDLMVNNQLDKHIQGISWNKYAGYNRWTIRCKDVDIEIDDFKSKWNITADAKSQYLLISYSYLIYGESVSNATINRIVNIVTSYHPANYLEDKYAYCDQ